MKLQRLAPRLGSMDTRRIKTLETTAGATPRISGRAWMKERQTALLAGLYSCVDCGLVSQSNEIDHHIPLAQGGANHQSNYRVRCIECHKAKTAKETKALFGRQ